MKTTFRHVPIKYKEPDGAWAGIYGPVRADLERSLLDAEAAKCLADVGMAKRYRLYPVNNVVPVARLKGEGHLDALEDAHVGAALMVMRAIAAGRAGEDPRVLHVPRRLCCTFEETLGADQIDPGPFASALDPEGVQRFVDGDVRYLLVPPGFLSRGESSAGLMDGEPKTESVLARARVVHLLEPIESPRVLAYLAGADRAVILNTLVDGLEASHADRIIRRASDWLGGAPHSGRCIEPVLEVNVPELPFMVEQSDAIGAALRIRSALPPETASHPILQRALEFSRSGLGLSPVRYGLAEHQIQHGNLRQTVAETPQAMLL